MVQLGFNAQEYDVPTFGEPIKPGWYAVRVTQVELKPTKAGNGQYLEVTLAIDENQHPDCAGRNVWDRLNVFHQNEKTMKIARGTLRKLQESCGKPTAQDTDELLGCSVLAKVKVRPATEEHRAQNEIDDYKPIGATIPAAGANAHAGAAQQPAAATQAPAQSTPAQVPAWMRK